MFKLKLKIKNLNRLVIELSNREIDLYFYLIKRQDEIGFVKGVYYQDVMDDLLMPNSTFYAALGNLDEKGFIRIDWSNNVKDFDIYLVDNSFVTKGDYKEGYVNINLDFILGEEFVKLQVDLKKFFMRMLGLQAHKRPVKILKDTMKRYKVYKKISELQALFYMEEDGDGYIFEVKDRVLKGSESNQKHLLHKQKVKSYCRDFNIEYTERELLDTYMAITTHIVKGRLKFIIKALNAIKDIGRLQPKLISYMCGKAY